VEGIIARGIVLADWVTNRPLNHLAELLPRGIGGDLVRAPFCQQFIEDDPEGILVTVCAHGPEVLADLLRAHVRGGARDPSAIPPRRIADSREAKINDPRSGMTIDQQIGRLQIPMQDARVMQHREGLAHVPEYPEALWYGQLVVLGVGGNRNPALDELHGIE